MAVTISELEGGKVIELSITEKLHKADYETFVPTVEKSISEHGKIRLLVEMRDFHGWDTSAIWEDIKFDIRHFAHFDRLAMIDQELHDSPVHGAANRAGP